MKSVYIKMSLAFLVVFFNTNSASSESYSSPAPGRRRVEGKLVKPSEARQILSKPAKAQLPLKMLSGMGLEATPEIVELARGLRNDPNLIYKFVHDHIDYTPIFGSVKGATMTLLDRMGNDFDQSSLLIALLRQAGYTADYVYGTIWLTLDQTNEWLGVSDPYVLARLIPSAGIPCVPYLNGIELDHVWVKVNIDGTDYVFDPSIKSCTYTSGIDLPDAMGYDPNDFLEDANRGAIIDPLYVKDINTPNIAANLTSYSTNLVNYIEANNPAATLKDIIGGRSIMSVSVVPRQTSLPYQLSVDYEWTDIPSTYRVSLRIQHSEIDETVYSEQVYGKRLTIFYNASNRPVLALDGDLLAIGTSTTPGTSQPITLTVDHPYAANGGTYCDDSRTFYITAGGSYLVVNGWAGTGQKVIEKHRQILKQNRHAGGSDTSEPVLGESLAMVGLTWLAECSRAGQISDQIANTATIDHHTLGVCGQYDAPYIDMPMCLVSVISHNDDSSKEAATFFTGSGHNSAFEWGVIEQLQPNGAVSTVKLIDIANTKSYNKIFDATSANYYSTIKPQLVNYDSGELSHVEAYINGGWRVILPQDGDLGEQDWEGIGFIPISPSGDQIAHIISGQLNGGFGVTPWLLSFMYPQLTFFWFSLFHFASLEPIDLVTGDYLYDNVDLTIGRGSYPFSLEFKRSYNSGASLDDGPLGLGWKHNLDITAKVTSDGFQGMGTDSPIDAAASIVESYVSIDVLGTTKTNLRLVVGTLAHKWFMDRLIDNIIAVDQPGNTKQFVKLADGNYNPPPGEADTLNIEGDNSFLLKTKHGEYLDFDPNGRISTWSDPNNTISYSYDANGKLLQVSNEFGRSLNFTYDINDANHISSVIDSAGRSVSYGYGGTGNLTSITDANGYVTTFVYDSNDDGRLVQIYYPAEPNNPFVTNVYDSLGRVKTQTNANGYTYQYFYTGYRTEEIDPCSHSNVYVFDENGRLISETDPLGNETVYQYDGQQRKTLVAYPRGNATQYVYDANHNVLQSIQIPVPGSGEPNIVETFTYEPNFNRVATYTDPNDQVTTFQYYSNGKLKQIDRPMVDGNTPQTRFTYNAHGQMKTVTDAEDMVTRYEYNTNGNLVATIVDYGIEPNNLNITTMMTYNVTGDVNSTTDPRGNTTSFEYDAIRRLIKTTSPAPFNYVTQYEYYPDGSLKQLKRQTGDPNQSWQSTSYTYTLSGKIETVTDPNGDVTEYQYDALDRLMKTADAEGYATTRLYDPADRLWKVIDANDNNSVTYTYNANSSIETLTDAKGNTTTYQYDGHNRLEKTIYPDSTFEQLSYDLAGNISQKQTRAGQIIGYAYDPLNRLKTKTLPGPQQIQHEYDLTGRLKAVTDTTGTIQHSFDAIGRLTEVTYPDDKSVSYQYDAGGNRLLLTYPDGTYVTYEYDSLNRLTHIRDADTTVVVQYDYDALSRRISTQYANGTSATYLYNIADRLLYLNNQMAVTSRSFAYTYDKAGNRLTMTTDVTELHQYSYDSIYQVTGADYPAGFFAPDTTFNYDPAGNRESVIDGGTTNYVSNNLNQYSSVGGVVYSYNDNGNLTYDGNNTYTYDAENRLMTANRTGVSVSYRYDAFGRRIRKTITSDETRVTGYVYDGDQIICEYDGSDKLVRKFLYGTGIDEAIRMANVRPSADIAQDGLVNFTDFAVLAKIWLFDSNDPSFDPNADLVADNVIDMQDLKALADSWLTDGNRSEDYYYHYDGLGSVIALTDSSGSLVEAYRYDVYGRADGVSSVGNPYFFTGRQYDAETGLYYYRARYYSPVLGRFLQTDPVGYIDSMGLYMYCGNNPVNCSDPLGNLYVRRRISSIYDEPFVIIKTEDNQVHPYKVSSRFDLISVLKHRTSPTNKISEIKIVGHGVEGWLGLGDSLLTGDSSSIGLLSLRAIIETTFTNDAEIYLQFCESAIGSDSVAGAFKKILPKSEVWGYTGKAYPIPGTFWTIGLGWGKVK